MAAPTSSARAARERKQKIFVVAGGLFLLLLLAIQVPKLLGGSGTATTAGTTTTSTLAADGASGETTPSVTAPVPTSATIALRDTDRPLPAGPGQLRSFSAFDRKDPFVQQIESPSPAAGQGATSGGGGAGENGSKAAAKTPSKGFTVDDAPAAAAVTVISVNGARQVLEPGSAFPAADPVFVLVAEQPNAKTAVIGVVGGAYANGARTTRLKVGKPLVLVNTTTGARYRVVLVAVGNTPASPAGSGGSSQPGAPTP